MFTRSRAHVFWRRPDPRAAVVALDRWFRKWGYRRRPGGLPAGIPVDRRQEVREWFVTTRGEWTVLCPEDVSEVLRIAYEAVHAAAPDVPVVVSRAYKYGDWNLKAYHQRDLVFKVGDDDDDELKWVGRPLDEARVPEVAGIFGGGPFVEDLLTTIVSGRPDPRDLSEALGLPSLAVGYPDLDETGADGWERHVWIDARSPVWRA